MKNAKWILGFVGALSIQASAADFKTVLKEQLGKLHLTQKIHAKDANPGQPPVQLPPPPPIRQATVRVRIWKSVLTKNSSGGYDSTNTEVCNRTATANVYDFRNDDPNKYQLAIEWLTCSSTILGMPVDVHIAGFVALAKMDLFGAPEEFKVALPMMAYQTIPDPSGVQVTYVMGNSGQSTDLAAKSLLIGMNPTLGQVCSSDSDGNVSCEPSITESFSAFVDVQD